MLPVYLTYILTFLVSAGLAMIGISLAYQLYREFNKPVIQIMLYHQIFIFSFLMYAIWGNLILGDLIRDITPDAEILKRISFYFTVLGMPLLMVSWFMLLRFGYMVAGYGIPLRYSITYFIVLILILISSVLLVHLGYVNIPAEHGKFIIRMLVWLNLGVHVVFFIPIIVTGKTNQLKETGLDNRAFLTYAAIMLVCSAALYFFDVAGYISTCVAIIFIFAGHLFFPVVIKRYIKPESAEIPTEGKMNFKKFCSQFEISRRESEVILEICTGKTNKAISEKLFITLQTVKDHTSRIYSKTGVKNRVQLANLVHEKTGISESVPSSSGR